MDVCQKDCTQEKRNYWSQIDQGRDGMKWWRTDGIRCEERSMGWSIHDIVAKSFAESLNSLDSLSRSLVDR